MNQIATIYSLEFHPLLFKLLLIVHWKATLKVIVSHYSFANGERFK